jgi:chemotaxis protein MotB
MAGDAKKLQPIIVKRIKKGGHGHHGGAWKIAYADFVTAMMAFFLLMWLLGSTTEGDKKGIADYFNSPLKVALLSSGSGAGDASHVVKGGGQDLTRTTGQVKRGEIEAKRDMTRDGLRIQIVDEQNRPMFASGSAVVQPYMRELLREIGVVLADVPNRLTLEGHTDALPFAGGAAGYSNWELSSDRANASRRELVAGGLADERVLRVQGLASSQPIDSADAKAPANRRISIIVMNREAEDRMFHTAPEVAEALGADAAPPAIPTPIPPMVSRSDPSAR